MGTPHLGQEALCTIHSLGQRVFLLQHISKMAKKMHSDHDIKIWQEEALGVLTGMLLSP